MTEQTTQHFLVPQHIKLNEEEKEKVLQQHNITIKQLPMILASDPTLKELSVKVGDIIRVRRNSATAKETDYYRAVIDG